MAKNSADLIICLILLTTCGVLFILNKSLADLELTDDIPAEYAWIARGLSNVLGYSTILLPGYLIYKYVSSISYVNKNTSGCLSKLIKKCFGEEELPMCCQSGDVIGVPRTPLQDVLLLMFYFTGLQVSFLSWGVLQEKVMTQKYVNNDGDVEYFKDSQFLVFVNRILAFCMSGSVLLFSRQPRHKCPHYKYAFCSLSNILSSWCQYEALKYVSFPHQVLAKAAKTIPVMIMGKIISRTKYEYYEYVTAIILSVGMLFFMLDTGNDRASSTVTTFSGVILLCSYIVFDSFTSNWQGALFKQYGMKPVQMMCAVNLFSCLFTSVSLLQQGNFLDSLYFMGKFPAFTVDCVLLSICSAAGQLFIFSTLATFGPLVFAIITTIRQGFSVLLSCIIYHHYVGYVGISGLVLVFSSILLRIYCSYRIKFVRKQGQKGAAMAL